MDLKEDGGIIFNCGVLEPDEMSANQSCVLDVADDGGASEEAICEILGIAQAEYREIFDGALRKLRHHATADELYEIFSELA